MKKLITSLALILFVVSTVFIGNAAESPLAENTFIGEWGLDIESGGAGWLNVHERKGFLDAELLWIGGSVVPVGHVYQADENTLIVTRTHEMKKSKDRAHIITFTLRIKKVGDQLEGTMTGPSRDGKGETVQSFTGRRMPAMPEAPDLSQIKFGKEVKLFNGKDLTGWKLLDAEKKSKWI